QNSSTTNCPKCRAEVVDGVRFCAECGSDVLNTSEKAAQNICPGCGHENPENSKFCAECGKLMPVDESQLVTANICPECGFKSPDNSQFCAECGKTLPLTNSTETVCPKCDHMNPVGATFCAECGKTLFEKKTSKNAHRPKRSFLNEAKSKNSSSYAKRPALDEIKSEAKSKSSGGFGGFLGNKSGLKKGLSKALGDIEEKTQPHLNNLDSSLNNLQNKEKESYGYLICEDCSGYYELQKRESPEDFDECSCGGKLVFSRNL
ncbi:MAG: zinc-ribbon domain-containing protein, partial [Methanobacteriaceae archaeon]|nr:zinc-ribbon domain-containing protein [Methanobacteriaceae archaeon]